jgi:holin-like protein
MPLHRITVTLRRALRQSRMAQIVAVLGFWLLGNAVVGLTNLPLPGGVVGMGIMLALLHSRWISPFAMRRGANWLIAEMLLFFVPAVMALQDHRELLGTVGLKLVAVILTGTILVMAGTALVVDFIYRWRTRDALG